MNIPDKAVEAAARAIADATDAHRGFIGTLDAARIALEAAAPFIAAQALRDEAALLRDKAKRLREEPGVRITFALAVDVIRDIADDMERRADELDPQ